MLGVGSKVKKLCQVVQGSKSILFLVPCNDVGNAYILIFHEKRQFPRSVQVQSVLNMFKMHGRVGVKLGRRKC